MLVYRNHKHVNLPGHSPDEMGGRKGKNKDGFWSWKPSYGWHSTRKIFISYHTSFALVFANSILKRISRLQILHRFFSTSCECWYYFHHHSHILNQHGNRHLGHQATQTPPALLEYLDLLLSILLDWTIDCGTLGYARVRITAIETYINTVCLRNIPFLRYVQCMKHIIGLLTRLLNVIQMCRVIVWGWLKRSPRLEDD